MNGKIEYLVTDNERLSPWLYHTPIIRVMEKLRLMFRNTHPHTLFLKGTDMNSKRMPFYLRFLLFMVIVAPVYFALMWFVFKLTRQLPFFWLELFIEAILMYGLFMLVASGSMSAQSKRYHSAEHQAVNAHRQMGAQATLDDALLSSRFHANCGTGAAFSVAVGVFLTLLCFYSFFSNVPDSFWLYGFLNFLLFPLGVSIGLELFSLIPNLYRRTGIIWLVYPSFLLQRLTTKKATPEEVEVAWLAIKKISELQGQQ